MATRKSKSSKRRASTKRRNLVNPVNPTRRRSTKRRGRRSAVYARRRNPVNPVNPSRRRKRYGRRRNHRNPVTGVLGRAVPLVIGSALIGASTQFVAPIVARFAPQLVTSPIGVAATTFSTGWALSMVARAFSFTRRWADDVLLAGAVLAGGQVFSAYVAPMIPRLGGGAANPTGGMGRRYRPGMAGIGAWPAIPPGMAPLPPAPPNGAGMNGMAALPGYGGR